MKATEKKAEKKITAGESIYLSENDVATLRECGSKFQYRKYGMELSGLESRRFIKDTIRKMAAFVKEGISSDGLEEALEKRFEEYERDWFASDVEYESEKKRDYRKVSRLFHYIESNDFQVREVCKPYQSSFSRPFQYKETYLAGLSGYFDLVLEKEGKITLVSLQGGKPPYSSLARKKENLSCNSLELLTIQLAGYAQYDNFSAELWYLSNKDDTGMNLSDFEHRPEKNIVRADFSEKSPAEIFSHFLDILLSENSCDCAKCFYKQLCQLPELRKDEKGNGERRESTTAHEKTFTPKQEQVISHMNGPMCVIAVPGAGKTTALVYRLVNLINQGVRPEKILMLTFTKKAAREISERVDTLLEDGKHLPVISTYNALGFSILKENPMYVGGRRLKLADDVDRYRMVYDALTSCEKVKDVSYAGIHCEHGLVRNMDAMFTEIEKISEEEFIRRYKSRKDVDGILRVYHAYKDRYESENFIGFDDQIRMVNELFEEYPILAERYGTQFEYIMVDEFQDTSEMQADMIYAMAKFTNNLVVVGDDDQAIYGWRGGTSEFMLNFQKDFPDAKMVYMEDNFRSGSGILTLADAIMAKEDNRYKKKITAHQSCANKPIYVKGVPGNLASMVSSLLKQGVQPGEICILGRTNKRLGEVEMQLAGVVPVTTPKDYLVQDAVFLAIADMLRLYFKGLDSDISFYRIMRYMGISCVPYRGRSLYQSMVEAGRIEELEVTPQCMNIYAKADTMEMKAGLAILKSFEKIKYASIKEALSTIIEAVFGIASHKVVDAIMEMVDERAIGDIRSLYALMDDMIKYQVTKRVGYEVSKNAVNLLTCHDSKGKEFNYVILYSVEDFNTAPDSLRCVYVAVTRAKKGLYMLEGSVAKEKALFDIMSPYMQVANY